MTARGEAPVEVALAALALLFAALGFGWLEPSPPEFEPGPRPEGALRVVTWNVGGAGGRGGTALDDDDLAAVAQTLLALDADLVLLQELSSDAQLTALARILELEATASTSGGSRSTGVLARGVLTDTSQLERRSLLVTWSPPAGEPIAVAALHAHAWSARERNAEIGAATVELLRRAAGGPAILAGDLNLDVVLLGRKDLFTDDARIDQETYGFATQELVDAALGAGPTAEPDRRLDYLLVEPRAFEVLAAGPWRGRRLEGMDHDPVVADLVLRSAR